MVPKEKKKRDGWGWEGGGGPDGSPI